MTGATHLGGASDRLLDRRDPGERTDVRGWVPLRDADHVGTSAEKMISASRIGSLKSRMSA
jgi:hypothetical protein